MLIIFIDRKSHLLSPEDLEIDWRPLYNLCRLYIDKRSSKGDLIRSYPTLDQVIMQTVRFSSYYFPKLANQEIIDELLPNVLPLDIGKVDSAMELLCLFINSSHYEGWFDYLMEIWNIYHYPSWNVDIMNTIAATASQNIGYIYWTPHIPIMFTRIMRSLELPVSYKQIKSSRNQSLSMDACATWIISVICPQYDTMKYLKNLFSTIESYLNPANSGKWVKVISELLVNLVQYFQDRLVSERYKKHSWKKQIPDDCKLRNEDVTEFVETFKPIAMTIIYSRMQSYDITKIIKGLADLRPELILPEIIEKVSTTAELINEPNKFTAALNCLSSVASAIVTNKKYCTSTKTELIPIMFSILPGIDSNDFKKTSITLHFLMTVSFLIPFVDCSKASLVLDDLTEDEILISEQTAQFEDFILQFIDRIFVLIESSSVENIRMEHASNGDNEVKSKLESLAEILIQNTSHSILSQCSQDILRSATKKIINYVKNNALEPRVAGTAMSILCKVFARVNPKEIYHALIPFIVEMIETHFNEIDDAYCIEKQNDDFLYYVQILSNLIRGDPIEIQQYIDTLFPIIDKLLKCKCKATNRNGANMIGSLLNILSVIQINDVKTVPEAYEKSLKEFFPIRFWGRKMNRDEKFDWFVPSENERKLCEKIIHYYLLPILDKLEKYTNGSLDISRDDMLLNLFIISSILKCNNFLDNWEEEPIKLVECLTAVWKPFKLALGYENLCVKMPDQSNVRKTIVNMLEKLQAKLLKDSEDDIKSFRQLISIWEKIHIKMNSSQSYDSQMKNYQLSKQFQDFKLCKVRKDIRAINATRVIVQHDLRDELTKPSFTPTHRRIMLNLITLGTSHYSIIRSLAQSKLFKMLTTYSFSYKSVVDNIVEFLKLDPNENHESFKGALYLIGTNRRSRLMLRSDWETIEKLWLTFLKTKLSEKHSIIRLMESITDGVNNEFQTISTQLFVDEEFAKFGASLMVDQSKLPKDYLLVGNKKLQMLNEKNEQCYQKLLNEILKYSQENSLHWRYNLLCGTFVNDLMHPFSKYPVFVSEIYCKNLINESISERMLALKIVSTVLKQQKRDHVKVTIDPYQHTIMDRNEISGICKPGLRHDNKWLQYDINSVPKNQEEWDEPRYIYKINGFFGWTPKVEVYAPNSMQPILDRSYNELSDHEKVFYSFFKDPNNLEKLIYYWSLEEKKGNEKFHRSRFFFIKQIFDIFGDTFLDDFLSYIEPLIKNQTSESSHRCAAEILTGMMRGAKHWNYEKTKNLYDKITPLIKLALDNITPESDSIWGCAFATASENMDPNKQYFLHEILLDNPIRDLKSFTDCSRLYCLQGAFNQHAWRMISVGRRLLNYLDPFLNHPFQNVRDRIGSTLINIFENDLNFEEYKKGLIPRVKDFLTNKQNEISIMENDENSNHVIETNTPYASSIRFFKTISQFLIGVLNRSTNGNESIYTILLPVAIRLEKCEYDVELAEVCTAILALIAQAFTQPSRMNDYIMKIEEVSQHSSWQCRLSAIDILQVLTFNNMPIVLSQKIWVEQIQSIVLRLLEDNMLEVRVKAAEVLGGLIHCSFLPATDKLLELFKKKCQTKIVKRSTVCSLEPNIRVRHSGVLGLCAFISAFPYEIPSFVPNVFEILHRHLDDPQPIPATIRKTLADFKRTHHDGWDFHQLKFTESQLAVLSDLSVPPSYFN
ncbi:hypothetical protein ACKWTF_000055 [Chironomus riparius]